MALESGAPIEAVYVAPAGRTTPAVVDVVARVFDTGVRVFDLAPGVIERISDTVTPQPVLAVVGFSPAVLEDIREASMVVVCVDVRDPGNAGTMIRTADAAGVDAVVCCDGTVDPTNPKTVRASAGSIFHTPVVVGGDAAAVLGELRRRGMITGRHRRARTDRTTPASTGAAGWPWWWATRPRASGRRCNRSWTRASPSPWSAGPSRSMSAWRPPSSASRPCGSGGPRTGRRSARRGSGRGVAGALAGGVAAAAKTASAAPWLRVLRCPACLEPSADLTSKPAVRRIRRIRGR